ncbi:uncharacterized protein [Onthophagus taurus]|uniref:uncharacterized protein n=1 Tax=Onthophagus taurus TaxID=166361 RepID=UPI000C20AB99|nr:uncharacterized protein LOC111416400 [Onthophagus taurus]
MKGEIIGYAHKDIYFLETNTKSESTDLANLFASPAGREMVKYKPRGKLKHKLNPAIEFFIHNKTKKTATPDDGRSNLELSKCVSNQNLTSTSTVTTCPESSGNPSGSGSRCSSDICSSIHPENGQRSRRNSIDLYEEAASILGLTCSQTDNCKCIECQCHYFDFEEDLEFSSGEYMVDHNSTCSIQ